MKWMDNREVTVISTAHDPKEVCSVQRRAKTTDVTYLLAVAEYNRIMDGVVILIN